MKEKNWPTGISREKSDTMGGRMAHVSFSKTGLFS
jgi:hypothetical protein